MFYRDRLLEREERETNIPVVGCDVTGGGEEVRNAVKLAERFHYGGYTDTAEERDGGASQPEARPASGGYLFLASL